MSNVIASFLAFNINAASQLYYKASTNFWLMAIVISTTITVVMSLKLESDITVREEQNVL